MKCLFFRRHFSVIVSVATVRHPAEGGEWHSEDTLGIGFGSQPDRFLHHDYHHQTHWHGCHFNHIRSDRDSCNIFTNTNAPKAISELFQISTIHNILVFFCLHIYFNKPNQSLWVTNSIYIIKMCFPHFTQSTFGWNRGSRQLHSNVMYSGDKAFP